MTSLEVQWGTALICPTCPAMAAFCRKLILELKLETTPLATQCEILKRYIFVINVLRTCAYLKKLPSLNTINVQFIPLKSGVYLNGLGKAHNGIDGPKGRHYLSLVYLTMVSVSHTTQRRMIGRRIGKDTVGNGRGLI
jgi:hypothetical protein